MDGQACRSRPRPVRGKSFNGTFWLLPIVTVALAWTAETTAADVGPAAADRTGPKVVVEEERHDFGKSEVGVGGRHAFELENRGDQPLVLTRGRSTCGCCTCVCAVRLPEEPVGPGKRAQVTLEWKSELYVGPFRQTATVLTNDPERPELTLSVHGRFTGPVGVAPSRVTLGSIRFGQKTTSEVRVFNYLPEPLEIVGRKPAAATVGDYFNVHWHPLSAREIEEEGEARGGYLVRIEIGPGLPIGAFEEEIVLETTSKSVPRIRIPVQGTVVSDMSIVGRGWNAQTGVLSMGTVKCGEGADWPLLIVVRGPHAREVRFKPVRSVPDGLVVEMESSQYVADTGLGLTRLRIRIPPGSEPSTHLGDDRGELGEITIQTDPPVLPDVNIRVRFAVAK